MRIVKLSSQSLSFPSPDSALRDPNSLLAIGGDLTVPRLREAYEHGIFPWYSPGKTILWWSPDPRAILFPAERHLSRSLKRFLCSNPFCITLNHDFAAVIALNHDFAAVIAACAHRPHEGTWIGPEMLHAYLQLHLLGYAHSVEVWQQGQLVGGMYGVAEGALCCGESMFSHVSNASKCALMAFAGILLLMARI